MFLHPPWPAWGIHSLPHRAEGPVREPCPVHCHGLCVPTRHTGPDFLQARALTSRSYLYAPSLLHSQLISEICASFWNDLSESPVGGVCEHLCLH